MKNNIKILVALMMVPMVGAYAQMQLPAATGNATVPINTPMSVGQGNVYEKEVTPLLRDISKKKSLLELRKLDRELEKLDEDALTAQMERDKALHPPTVNVNPNSPNFGQNMGGSMNSNPMNSKSMTPGAMNSNNMNSNNANSISTNSNGINSNGMNLNSMTSDTESIRVLMVYGFDNDLYAKVSNGTQGGYIVRKGDILPDGRMVTEITPNFIEVKKASKTKSKTVDKLYVSGPLPVKAAGSTTPVLTSPVATSTVTPGSAIFPPPTAQMPTQSFIPNGAVALPTLSPGSIPGRR